MEGDWFDQMELHLNNYVNNARRGIEDRIDFRNTEIGEVVNGQYRQYTNITNSYIITQEELREVRRDVVSNRTEIDALEELIIKVLKG